MIAEWGQWALALALAISGVTGVFTLYAVNRNRAQAVALASSAAQVTWLVFLLVTFAWCCLIWSFVVSDFSVRNVAENSNSLLPVFFRFAASWGSHEGSLLLWVLMLTGWGASVAGLSDHLSGSFRSRVLGVLMLVNFAFLLFLITASNPFERIIPMPAEGRDLNPLLQDIVMIIHPPMLYMGYVGFAVSFAFAMAALMEGRLDATWARWSRPWANAAWAFLTVGILLGSWWAYRELGWGGWWFWDPVENASLMPWLAGTALIHSLAVTDKRDALKSWTLLLALVAFALSLLGTFLVRSGVLTSVHAFATDPKRGVFILVLLLIVIGAGFLLYALRTKDVGLGGSGFAVTSRESLLLSNNVLMSAALAAVMLGTLYPLFTEILADRKMSVGPPYFEAVFAPLLLPAVWLMALGPVSRWKEMTVAAALKALMLPVALAAGVAVAVVVAVGYPGIGALAGLTAAVGLAAATVEHAWKQLQAMGRSAPNTALTYRAGRLGHSYWAMIVAHLGVAAFVAGVTLVKTYESERDVLMVPGQTESIGPWRVTFIGVSDRKGPNFVAAHGVFELTSGEGKNIVLLEPEKRRYIAGGQTMTEADVDASLTRDVYVSLGEPVENPKPGQEGAWSVRLYLKPFIAWIWIGCIMMAVGGVLTLLDKRYKRVKARSASKAAVSGGVGA